MSNNNTDIKILPEDKVNLTQEQQNLIQLAFEKQVPPEDAKFIEKIQDETKNGGNPFTKLSDYYTAKYGMDFGMIYLAAIMGGKEKYEDTVKSIERLKASERVEKSKNN